ncbi:MAG: SDR family oxidoreductase [Phycisphaerae bacterium]
MSEVRRTLVTGAGRGIGRCIAETLARDGCDVAILDRETPPDSDGLVRAIESSGRRCLMIAGDVRDADSVGDAVESVVGRFGGLDIVVNNAGIVRDRVSWKMADEQWQDVIDVNLTGVFNVCRAAIPCLRKAGWGAIVNIASINGLRGKLGQANYSAAKAGVIGLTKTLAKEVARFNITVNAVAPGFIETDIVRSMPAEAKQQAVDEILLGRPGQVGDVAEAVAFLCGGRARFITGEVLRVDGGQYI